MTLLIGLTTTNIAANAETTKPQSINSAESPPQIKGFRSSTLANPHRRGFGPSEIFTLVPTEKYIIPQAI
jgi:hypothetical protein